MKIMMAWLLLEYYKSKDETEKLTETSDYFNNLGVICCTKFLKVLIEEHKKKKSCKKRKEEGKPDDAALLNKQELWDLQKKITVKHGDSELLSLKNISPYYIYGTLKKYSKFLSSLKSNEKPRPVLVNAVNTLMNYFEIEKELFNLEEYLKTKNINVLYTLIVLLIESIFKMKDDYNPRKERTEPLYNKRDYFHALYYIDFENDNYLSHNYLFNFKRRESAMGDDMGFLHYRK